MRVALVGPTQRYCGEPIRLPASATQASYCFPETWCLSLAEAWQAGLAVAAFDVGAQAERIRGTGRGFLLPLGLPAGSVNNALLAACGLSRHE